MTCCSCVQDGGALSPSLMCHCVAGKPTCSQLRRTTIKSRRNQKANWTRGNDFASGEWMPEEVTRILCLSIHGYNLCRTSKTKPCASQTRAAVGIGECFWYVACSASFLLLSW